MKKLATRVERQIKKKKLPNGKVGNWSLSLFDENGKKVLINTKRRIRNDIPIPWEALDKEPKGRPVADTKTRSKYPLERMAPGDSFFIVNRSEGTSESYNYRSVIKSLAVKLGICVAIQHRIENGVDGQRVWRWK